MKASLAPFSWLCEVTCPSVEGIANWLSLWCHLMQFGGNGCAPAPYEGLL
jgi:hypothetical protein